MPELEFRPLVDDDVEEVIDLVLAARQTWNGRCTELGGHLRPRLQGPTSGERYVVVEDVEIVGFSLWKPELDSMCPRPDAGPTDAHLESFYVRVDRHGTVVAPAMHHFTEEAMLAGGYKSARLWTPHAAPRAQAFYKANGWRPSGRTMVYENLMRLEFTRQMVLA